MHTAHAHGSERVVLVGWDVSTIDNVRSGITIDSKIKNDSVKAAVQWGEEKAL